MSSSPSPEDSKTLFHFGGGQLTLPTLIEREAFARGRLESAADLAEVCATSVKTENAGLHTTLRLIVSMLHEANEALPSRK